MNKKQRDFLRGMAEMSRRQNMTVDEQLGELTESIERDRERGAEQEEEADRPVKRRLHRNLTRLGLTPQEIADRRSRIEEVMRRGCSTR